MSNHQTNFNKANLTLSITSFLFVLVSMPLLYNAFQLTLFYSIFCLPFSILLLYNYRSKSTVTSSDVDPNLHFQISKASLDLKRKSTHLFVFFLLLPFIIFNFELVFFVNFVLFSIFFATETLRRLNIHIPLSKYFNFYSKAERNGAIGSHLLFIIGQLFASLLCPPLVYSLILGVGVFSDAISSQIGLKLNSRLRVPVPWNNKSGTASVAGGLIALLLGILFMDYPLGGLFALGYICIDLHSNKHFRISDNILIPIALTLIYLIYHHIYSITHIII